MHFTLIDWILNFCLFFFFRCRQANIGSTVLSPVSTTPVKNLSAVSLTPVNSFSAVFDNGAVEAHNRAVEAHMEPWRPAGQCCRFVSLLIGIRIRIKKAGFRFLPKWKFGFWSISERQVRSGFDPHQSYADLQQESRVEKFFHIRLIHGWKTNQFSEGEGGISGTHVETHLKNSIGSSLLPDLRRSSRLPSKVLSTGNSAHLKKGHKLRIKEN